MDKASAETRHLQAKQIHGDIYAPLLKAGAGTLRISASGVGGDEPTPRGRPWYTRSSPALIPRQSCDLLWTGRILRYRRSL